MTDAPGTKQEGASASQRISERISELGDWRGETFDRIRALINSSLDGNVRRAIDIREGEKIVSRIRPVSQRCGRARADRMQDSRVLVAVLGSATWEATPPRQVPRTVP